MNNSLYIAATGMQAQQLGIDTVANNLVNVNTAGFKKSHVNFQELMQVGAAGDTDPAPAGSPLGIGISANNAVKDFSTGTITQTGSPMDIAINGTGFIEVTLTDGSLGYSRGGTLQVTKDSYLATSGGYVLKPSIHLPANVTAINIGTDGKVTVQTASQTQPTEVGQIELVSFANTSALKEVGSGVYAPTEASGQAMYGKPGTQGLGTIAQNSLESSNVSMVDEMVALMVTQRAYELSSKVAQASDELMSLTNNLRR